MSRVVAIGLDRYSLFSPLWSMNPVRQDRPFNGGPVVVDVVVAVDVEPVVVVVVAKHQSPLV